MTKKLASKKPSIKRTTREDYHHLARILSMSQGKKAIPPVAYLVGFYSISYSTAYRDRVMALAVRDQYAVTARLAKLHKASKKGASNGRKA